MINCPDCGTQNDESARFCDNCGHRLDDVEPASDPGTSIPEEPIQSVASGTPAADDGLPVGRDLDGIPGGERIIGRVGRAAFGRRAWR